ncbi:MAG: hypothetical protein NC094_01310 [Bacteroidales bacterium]|nr:hypothetical protein [Lachnoclostridium sp.]MCM1384488.1 hypothetical protein [Lachnoclostridium sp.]MCM1464032.1 hypothetical protein [Bacteroidales bacterium]
MGTEVGGLEIRIESDVKSVNKSLDDLVEKLGLIVEGITVIGKNSGLEEFAKKAQEITKNLGSFQNAAKGISASMEPQVQKAAKSLEELSERFKDLGKSFTFKGSAVEIQKQIDKYTNSLNLATLKKAELEATGKTEGKAYEDAVAKAIEYTNVIENLKTQLAELQAEQPQFDVNISGLQEAQQEVSNIFEEIREGNPVLSFFNDDAMRSVFGEATKGIENYEQAFERFGEKYGQILNSLPQTEINISGMQEAEQAADNLLETLREVVSVPMDSLNYNADAMAAVFGEAARNIENYQQAVDRFGENAGLAMNYPQFDISGLQEAQQNVDSLSNQLQNMRSLLRKTFTHSSSIGDFNALLSGIGKSASMAVSALSQVASTVSKLTSKAKSAFSRLSQMAKSLTGIKGASKGMNISLGGGLKTILKYSLGIRSLYSLINKLRNAMKEGFKNLAQYSSETNTSISMLQSSLEALKNSLAAAFAPILNVIAPALSAFIDMLTKAFNTVGQFFSALTGKSLAVQAKKTFTDYADSVSEAGSATKDAGKDVQKGLRAFDELNVIYTNNKEESGGSGEITPSDMFETVPIDSNVSDFAQKIKDAWASADFAELGAILGVKIKSALDGINWAGIKETAVQIGKSIATLINGAVESDGLAVSIGRTIGKTINTAIAGINAFLDNTHWDSVGIFLGEGLNEVFNTVDWEGLSHLYATELNGIFEVLENFFETFDWENAGTKLSVFVNNLFSKIDWGNIGTTFINSLNSVISLLKTFIAETNWYEIGKDLMDALTSAVTNIDWKNIGETISNAAVGLVEMLLAVVGETDWGHYSKALSLE